eukprot:XP_019076306.1 PREDICTED: uncharacterized protein LOC100244484 isoform X4 [Vitis vinifera]
MMELSKGTTFLPQFRVSLPYITCPVCKRFRVSASFGGETFSVSFSRWKKLEAHCNNSESIRHSAISKSDSSRLPELSFNRLQLTDEEYCGLQRRNFGRFVAREAVLDEEYWTAAWLRAEAHWESLSYMRHVDNYKRKYAEEVKEEKNIRRTVLNSVVGTLDLSIRQYIRGETYPGEIKRLSSVLASPEPFDAHKYAYIANVCVSKFARRQGIALNMLSLANDVASSAGMKQLFVHVNADNKPAQELYKRTGFKVLLSMFSEFFSLRFLVNEGNPIPQSLLGNKDLGL